MTAAYEVMIDARHVNVPAVPVDTPAVGLYVTGTPDIRATMADIQRFPNSRIVRIDQAAAWTDPFIGDVLDVETGAASLADAIAWARVRRNRCWTSVPYIGAARLDEMRVRVHDANLADAVWYWVANWNLDEAEAASCLHGDVLAVQWASPTSNPGTPVPGTLATLAEANVDLSVKLPGWPQVPTWGVTGVR